MASVDSSSAHCWLRLLKAGPYRLMGFWVNKRSGARRGTNYKILMALPPNALYGGLRVI
jgi:hypothetical protein